MNLKISVLLPAKNEAHRIKACLESLLWVDEIVILLDQSTTDHTYDVVSSYPHVRVIPTIWQGYGPTKAWGLQHCKNPWIFWMDADEVLPLKLQQEIQEWFTQKENQLPDAFSLPRLPFLCGNPIKHSGWYPGRVIRLFRKEKGSFSHSILHESVQMQEKSEIIPLQNDLLHYSYSNYTQFFEKMVQYGPLGAQEAYRKGKRFYIPLLILKPFFTFFKFYILKKGFLDGFYGFLVCAGSAFSTFIRYAHLHELELKSQKKENIE